jgi:hypothetical protein
MAPWMQSSFIYCHSRESGNPSAFINQLQNGFPIKAFGNDKQVTLNG